MTEARIFVIALARAAKSQQEKNCWLKLCMGTRPCQSFAQNVTSKLLKTEKIAEMTKMIATSWLPSLPPFRKSGSRTVNTGLITKALAITQLIFKPEGSGLSSQEFLQWAKDPVRTTFSDRDFEWW
jgi:hypothetical protein